MSDLRDLARQIDELARVHPAHNQAREIVAHCCSMLQLLAGYQEGLLAVTALAIRHDCREPNTNAPQQEV
jgi:hypothetical protein